MKIDYIKHGDICLPALKPPEGTYEIGRFGRMYLDHIKKNRRVVYSQSETSKLICSDASTVLRRPYLTTIPAR